ncbi:MAG: archaeal proteasome endopeptidase complex subunit beta [Candidatus Bathyarchaeota archaeon]
MIENTKYKLEDLVHKGTTTVAIVCQDGVVFGTDTRVTAGYFVAHKSGKKVYKIAEHMAMTIAGVVADAQNVVEILKANASLFNLENQRPMMVSAAARLAANVLFSSRGFPLILQALIGGVDDSGTHVFAVDPYGSVIEETCASTGSGSPIAYGVLEDRYRKNMTVKEGIPLVVSAVTTAMKRDIGSGDSFDVVVIGKDGYRELTVEEKKEIEKKISA